jgi:hypothetical protein
MYFNMRISWGFAMAAIAGTAMANEGFDNHDYLKPHTHVAYHHVESACAADVENMCSPKQDVLALPHPSSGDPFLDWVLFSPPFAPPPPEVEDLSLFMNRVFDSVFEPRYAPQISVVWFQEAVAEEPDMVIDSAVARLAADKQPEEIPELAHQLQHFGQGLLHDAQVHGERHRMARRLTEMDPMTIQHYVALPFGCSKNRCLREAFEKHQVSRECAHSIHVLERTFVLENELDRRQGIFIGMMWIYIGALALLMMLVARNYRARRGRRRLKQKILLAVYGNPAIRKQVEDELEESIGEVPPLSYHVMRLLSAGGKDLKRRMRCLRQFHAILLICLMALVFVAPFWVLPICIVVTLVRVAQLCFVNSELEAEDCTCCCCAASPGMAQAGILSEEQACCACCKGTGICSPKCASCCGSAGCCSCCCSSCCEGKCCCAPTQPKMAEDDCTCCCCDASPSLAKAGLLTDEQACCGCCKGTGKCSDSCAACCGGGGSGCCCGCCCSCCSSGCCCQMKGYESEHVVTSKVLIYEGIPLQVV